MGTLYIGGGFDILHEDHKKFIKQGRDIFKKKYGPLEKVIIGLKSDMQLNAEKGITRPFFSYDWRKEDISQFLHEVDFDVIDVSRFMPKIRLERNVVAQVSSEYTSEEDVFKKMGIPVEYVKPFNSMHTTTIENKLSDLRNLSSCNLRKVAALLLRNGKIVAEGYSGSGDCNCCSKYAAYQKGGGQLSQKIPCDFPHAEIMVLKNAAKDDDLIITDSPCGDCAELVAAKGIRRVVYVKEYYDSKPLSFLKNSGIMVRRAGYVSALASEGNIVSGQPRSCQSSS
jgi:dCMP deaminase